MFLFNCPMYLIDILFKRLKLLYLCSQFNYCMYTNSFPLWWLSWLRLLISHLDTLLDFRCVCGCDSPLVVVHIVQYFYRLRAIVTSVNMKPGFANWCNCVKYCGPCGNSSVAFIDGLCGRQASGSMCGSDWSYAGKYLSMQLEWSSPHDWAKGVSSGCDGFMRRCRGLRKISRQILR